MRRFFERHLLKVGLGVLLLAAVGVLPHREFTLGTTPPDWVSALDHDWATIRSEAKRRLIDVGESSVQPIVDAFEAGEVEREYVVFDVLSDLYNLGDDATADRVEDALQVLGNSRFPRVRGQVLGAYVRVRDRRERRLLERCRAKGAIVRFAPTEGTLELRERSLTILLDDGWTGGSEGLDLVTRVPRLGIVQVFASAPVSENDIEAMRRRRPKVAIVRRGTACLGIAGRTVPNFFLVAEVESLSGAARGGVEEGDLVAYVEDARIDTYEALFPPLLRAEPGETARLLVLRRSRWVEIEVLLGRDDFDERCRCDDFEILPTTLDPSS